MPQWTIERPEQRTFAAVTELSVRIVAGRVAVLASEGPPAIEVTEIGTSPLIVTQDEDGRLAVSYPPWEGLFEWLRSGQQSAVLTVTVPKDCQVQVGVVSASALVAGLRRRVSVKSVSGEIVLDGVSGEVRAETVTGAVESRGLAGNFSFTSVSGELTVAHGVPHRMRANTVSGQITADLELTPTAHVTLNSVSGAVLMRLPAETDSEIALRSAAGRVDTTFAGLRGGDSAGKTLTGRLGGGMASVSATTVSSDVTLLSKAAPSTGGEERA